MDQGIGLKLHPRFLIDMENNADRDGIIISTPVSTKIIGPKVKIGCFFYYIHYMETNGLKLLNHLLYLVELITTLKTTGILQCEGKSQVFMISWKVL